MTAYNRKDKFYQKAKKEGLAARSAYKLVELDKKWGIFKPSSCIVDLGCAPGGWLQIGEQKMSTGTLVGIDLLPLQFQPGPHTFFIQGDFLDPKNQELIKKQLLTGADWVLSDMSPNLTGIKFKDLAASLELCEKAYEFALGILKNRGGFIIKIFPGPDAGVFKQKLKTRFNKVSEVLPEATRKTSNEVYWVATEFRK